MSNVTPEIASFVETVRAFCAWAEGAPPAAREIDFSDSDQTVYPLSSEEVDGLQAMRLLSRLYAQAQDLPDRFGEEEAPDIPKESVDAIWMRAGALPVGYYWSLWEPLKDASQAESKQEATQGIIWDDISDIWRNVKAGLALFDAGSVDAAVWQWRWGLANHWGRHALWALTALHAWLQKNHCDFP